MGYYNSMKVPSGLRDVSAPQKLLDLIVKELVVDVEIGVFFSNLLLRSRDPDVLSSFQHPQDFFLEPDQITLSTRLGRGLKAPAKRNYRKGVKLTCREFLGHVFTGRSLDKIALATEVQR